jgi:hypothetical protein
MTHDSGPKVLTMDKTNNDCCGARSGGSVIKLPPKSGAVITIAAPDSLPDPFYFMKDMKKFYCKNLWLLKNS